jgi:DNA polymerase-3 subunit alpha
MNRLECKKYMKDLKPTVLEIWSLWTRCIVQDHWNIFLLSFDEKWRRGNQIRSRCLWEYLGRNLRNYRLPRAGDALSQLARIYKGEADVLRKAMGRNKKEDKWNQICGTGCCQRTWCNHSRKIWKDWEAFASYAFNKSLYLLCLDCTKPPI